jgi:hypothetical protein
MMPAFKPSGGQNRMSMTIRVGHRALISGLPEISI